MSHDHHHHHHRQERSKETKTAALVGAVVNMILAVSKTVGGVLTNSHALLADGIHSISDLASDAIVWWASHHSAEAPDEDHPYGHGRFETAATLALGMFLILVAVGILWDGAERFFDEDHAVPDQWALWIAGFSILANEGLFWYTIIVARRIKSDMLRANAWHHRTDAISSIVVLVGIGGALMGWTYLDTVAALIVGVMVGKIGWELGWSAMEELVDKSLDEEQVQQAREIIMNIDGVCSVHMLRTRYKGGNEASADVHVQVPPRVSVSEGHVISQAVEDRLKAEIDLISDVTVHIDPEDDEDAPTCRGLSLRPATLAKLRELWQGIEEVEEHGDIHLHYLSGKIDVDMVLPLEKFESIEATQVLKQKLRDRLSNSEEFGELHLMYE